MALIQARVSEVDKTRFKAMARAVGKTESEFLREMIEVVLSGDMPEQPTKVQPPRNATQEDIAPKQVSARVPGFIKDNLIRAAKGKGLNPGRYLAGIVQAHFTNYPIMTDIELAALKHSNRELASIGRNLNQVTRVLNESFQEADRIKVELIKETTDLIKSNQQEIRRFVRASNQAWCKQ